MWNKTFSLLTGKIVSAESPMVNQAKVSQNVEAFEKAFSDSKDEVVHGNSAKVAQRKEGYKAMVSQYYDMATDFYEKGMSIFNDPIA